MIWCNWGFDHAYCDWTWNRVSWYWVEVGSCVQQRVDIGIMMAAVFVDVAVLLRVGGWPFQVVIVVLVFYSRACPGRAF